MRLRACCVVYCDDAWNNADIYAVKLPLGFGLFGADCHGELNHELNHLFQLTTGANGAAEPNWTTNPLLRRGGWSGSVADGFGTNWTTPVLVWFSWWSGSVGGINLKRMLSLVSWRVCRVADEEFECFCARGSLCMDELFGFERGKDFDRLATR